MEIKMNNNHISVVYITDVNYLMPTCVSIASLIYNSEDELIDIYVLCDGLDEKQINVLNSMETSKCKINVIMEGTENYTEAFKNGWRTHVSRSALLKFELCNILKDIDRVLYIDCDTVVLKSLHNLFNIDLEGYYLAAVDDLNDEILELRYAEKINLQEGKYFNSGVMLINLKKWREDDITTKLVDYKMNGINLFVDQDALNVVCAKRQTLGFEYNFLQLLSDNVDLEDIYKKYNLGKDVRDFSEYLSNMSIIHFAGARKPWEYNLPWYTDIFKKYYNMTPYKDETLKLKSPIKWYNSEYVCEDLLIPYKEVGRDSRIVIYGGGKFGKKCMEQLKIFNYGNVVGWVDKYISNDEISSIDRLREMKYDYILIAVKRRATIEEIINELEGTYEIPSEKIVSAFRMFKRY